MFSEGRERLHWERMGQANILYLFRMKTSENMRFSDVFRDCRNGILSSNGLSTSFPVVFTKAMQMTTNHQGTSL